MKFMKFMKLKKDILKVGMFLSFKDYFEDKLPKIKY